MKRAKISMFFFYPICTTMTIADNDDELAGIRGGTEWKRLTTSQPIRLFKPFGLVEQKHWDKGPNQFLSKKETKSG